ncbi:hypothetical protein J1614_010588 [Plenodomus biglobosus]|nr:hypothetical protein J1614_010588 [Plenodomus biglobosus]
MERSKAGVAIFDLKRRIERLSKSLRYLQHQFVLRLENNATWTGIVALVLAIDGGMRRLAELKQEYATLVSTVKVGKYQKEGLTARVEQTVASPRSTLVIPNVSVNGSTSTSTRDTTPVFVEQTNAVATLKAQSSHAKDVPKKDSPPATRSAIKQTIVPTIQPSTSITAAAAKPSQAPTKVVQNKPLARLKKANNTASTQTDDNTQPSVTETPTEYANQLLPTLPAPTDKWHRFFTYIKRDPSRFELGDIAWYPILRPSNDPSDGDLITKHGRVCAKLYPVILVEKLPDCMICVPILTAGGRGLERKPTSIRLRSKHIVSAGTSLPRCYIHDGCGLGHNAVLKVIGEEPDASSYMYEPSCNAFVDLVEEFRISYDSRFKKEGRLTEESKAAIDGMRGELALTRTRMYMKPSYFRNLLSHMRLISKEGSGEAVAGTKP